MTGSGYLSTSDVPVTRFGSALEVSRGWHYSAGFGYPDAPLRIVDAQRGGMRSVDLPISSIKNTWNRQCQTHFLKDRESWRRALSS
jgi:hypothetical protein